MEDLNSKPFKVKDRTNIKFLDRIKSELNVVSRETRVEVKDIEIIVEHLFKTIKTWITDPRMPTIKISNLGTFKPSYAQIGRSLSRTINSYRLGTTPPEKLRSLVKKVWPIRKRIQKEKLGYWTWKEWRNKVME